MSAYEEALRRGRETGASRAPAAESLALFCDGPLQNLVGAVSPELVWTGAVARRMTVLEFGRLCAQPMEVNELQWIETVTVSYLRGRYRLDFSPGLQRPGGPSATYDAHQAVYELALTTSLGESEARALLLEAMEHTVSGREIKR